MSKCENLIKFLTLIAFTASLAFVLNSCAYKSGLKARCSTAVIDYVDDRLKKGLQCYELGQSEEKKGKFEKAFLYYETACKLIAPNNACAKLSEIKPKVPKFDKEDKEYVKNFFDRECKMTENIYTCLELKKIELNELKERGENLESFISDIEEFSCKSIPQICYERDKLYISAILALPKDERSSGYYMKRLNWNCRSEAPISKNACEARDEIVAEMEKECNENDTKRCADLAYISYGFLMGDWYGEYRNVIQSYKTETDRIYPAKFKVAANKACDAGWISSCMELAFFHYDYEPERNFNLVRQYGKKLYLHLKDAKNRGTLREGLAREYLITLAGMEAVLDDSDKDERKQFAINYFKVGCDDLEEAWVCYKFAEIIYDKGEDDYNSKNGRRNYKDVANINQKDALHYYDKACVLGGVGCAELAEKYLWGDYVGDKKLKPNLAKLRHYLIKDCDFGDKESCFAKGLNDKELYERAKSYFDDHSCGGCDDDECK